MSQNGAVQDGDSQKNEIQHLVSLVEGSRSVYWVADLHTGKLLYLSPSAQ